MRETCEICVFRMELSGGPHCLDCLCSGDEWIGWVPEDAVWLFNEEIL